MTNDVTSGPLDLLDDNKPSCCATLLDVFTARWLLNYKLHWTTNYYLCSLAGGGDAASLTSALRDLYRTMDKGVTVPPIIMLQVLHNAFPRYRDPHYGILRIAYKTLQTSADLPREASRGDTSNRMLMSAG